MFTSLTLIYAIDALCALAAGTVLWRSRRRAAPQKPWIILAGSGLLLGVVACAVPWPFAITATSWGPRPVSLTGFPTPCAATFETAEGRPITVPLAPVVSFLANCTIFSGLAQAALGRFARCRR